MENGVGTAQDPPSEFAVKDCALLAIATGRRVYTLSELRGGLEGVGEASIYYHFWGSLLQPRFGEREYNNDFAGWALHSLHDTRLAERMAMLDPREYPDLSELRFDLLEIIDERLDEADYLHWMPAAQPFQFMRSQIVVFSTDKRVSTPAELLAILPTLPVSSLFYHFIDARRRVPEAGDDFSAWLSDFGDMGQRLRDGLARVDPYFATLGTLRDQVVTIFAAELEDGHAA